MSILGTILGGLIESNSARQSLESSIALQNHQYLLDREARKNSFQDTRYSLEQAGYNPLLAVGQQSNGGSYGATLSVTDPKSERLNNILASAQMASQTRLNSAQAYNQYMQGNLTTAQANNLISSSQLNSAQTALTNLQQNAQAITNLHLPSVLKSQIKLNTNMAQAQIINANANSVSAQANMMNANSNRINANANSALSASQVYRNNNASLGYTTSMQFGPFSFSHTGNPNLYTQGSNSKNPTYQTEYINGKPVQVRVIR